MESNMGSQEQETIAKYLEDSTESLVEKAVEQEDGHGAVPHATNGNVAMQDTQATNESKALNDYNTNKLS